MTDFAKTGPAPDPESGTLDSAEVIDQISKLSERQKSEGFHLSIWYDDVFEFCWVGEFRRGGRVIQRTGRYPTEVIYQLLRDWEG